MGIELTSAQLEAFRRAYAHVPLEKALELDWFGSDGDRAPLAATENSLRKSLLFGRTMREILTEDQQNRLDAVRLADEAVRTSEDRLASAHRERARALVRLGRFDEAEASPGRAIRLQPHGALFLERGPVHWSRFSRRSISLRAVQAGGATSRAFP